ncbi:30S ribosomal protein S20 [Blattabacterium sp. (Cryptocercus kyebangensis)]|uniref:30S ribosomal protein S20 n=1 Tax=Blattabacterium sp. (Cryptocercus kyebangensis) TaxID=298656 RepID=UPI000D7C9CFB|nr:30S ribosomal protein S20 [Blattabacterium sp. (Cryptocercus kyebangensis)]AWU43807.1 30S ribosomal protein S20 [Blattabacterium sp. (Cryptocercus kyebangensis)]
MANHLSALKRIRQNHTRRLRNKYVYKSTRTSIKQLIKGVKKKEEYSKVFSMIDKLSKKNIIHMNKAARLKNKLRKNLLINKFS